MVKIINNPTLHTFAGIMYSSDLAKDLKKRDLKVKKIINYTSTKNLDLSNENKEMIKTTPDLVFRFIPLEVQKVLLK